MIATYLYFNLRSTPPRRNLIVECVRSMSPSSGSDWEFNVRVESAPEEVHFTIHGTSTIVDYQSGETILETARRGLLYPPFRCRKGECGTCKAVLEDGAVIMRNNNYLSHMNIRDGWILTCQALPTSSVVRVNYDAQPLMPGIRFLLRSVRNLLAKGKCREM